MKKLFTRTHLWLFFILVVAAFMRLYKIGDYLTFLGDEGRDVLVVYNILHGHLTLLGPTSSVGGFFLGPIYYYFMAPFLWAFNYNPVGPAVMVALFSIGTVWLIYYIGSKFFSTTTGLIGALLYAISPLVLTYARSSWNPNLMPITTLLLLYTLYLAFVKKHLRYFFVTGVLFGIAMQLHYIEVFVGAIIIFYTLLGAFYVKKSFWEISKDFCLLLVGFLVGWSPFLAFEFRHGFTNIRAIVNFIFHPNTSGNGVGTTGNSLFIVQDIFYRVFGRLLVNVPSPDLYHLYTNIELTVWFVAAWLIGICCTVFLLIKLLHAKKDTTKFLQYLLLSVWLILGILFFGLYKKNIYDYYFEFLFPLPFLLVGGLIGYLFTKKIWIKIFASVCVLLLVLINLQGIPFQYTPNRELQQTETISRFVLDKTNNQPFNFALITGGNSDQAYRYFFTIWGHSPVTIQDSQVDPQRTTVTKQLLIICESLPCYPLGNPLWEIAGFGRAQIAGQWDVSVVQIYKLVHYKGK